MTYQYLDSGSIFDPTPIINDGFKTNDVSYLFTDIYLGTRIAYVPENLPYHLACLLTCIRLQIHSWIRNTQMISSGFYQI